MKISVKFALRVCAGFIVALAILFAGFFFFVRVKGKELACQKLSKLLERPVTIGDIGVIFPLGLRLTDLHIEGYGDSKAVTVGLGVVHLLDNNLIFSTIIFEEPQLVLHRTKENSIVFGDLSSEGAVKSEDVPKDILEPGTQPIPEERRPKKSGQLNFTIDNLIIKKGTVSFFDHSAGETPLQIVINRINLNARHVSDAPRATKTKFDFTAAMMHPETKMEAGNIESRGWANFARKDMEGELKIENLEGKLFSKFFGDVVKSDFMNMKADLYVDVVSKNNDMIVKGKLQVKDFALAVKSENSNSIESLILGGLQSMAKGLALEFSFKTKMDDFKMESVSFTGNIFSRLFDFEKPVRLARVD